MRPKDLARPLEASELEELARFLAGSTHKRKLPWVQGFLTAVVSGPTVMLIGDWQRIAIGEPRFASAEEATRVIGLLTRLHDRIASDLAEGRAIAPDGDLAEVDEWCAGYLAGTRLDDAWRRDSHAAMLLFPFAVLCGEYDLVGETDDKGAVIEDAAPHIERYRGDIPMCVAELYRHWRGGARARGGGAPARRTSKVGRNELCPCGSGRKNKKCCNVTVH